MIKNLGRHYKLVDTCSVLEVIASRSLFGFQSVSKHPLALGQVSFDVLAYSCTLVRKEFVPLRLVDKSNV